MAGAVLVANEGKFASVGRPDDRAEDVAGCRSDLARVLAVGREEPDFLIGPVVANDSDLRAIGRNRASAGVVHELARAAAEKRDVVDARHAGSLRGVDEKMAAIGKPGFGEWAHDVWNINGMSFAGGEFAQEKAGAIGKREIFRIRRERRAKDRVVGGIVREAPFRRLSSLLCKAMGCDPASGGAGNEENGAAQSEEPMADEDVWAS